MDNTAVSTKYQEALRDLVSGMTLKYRKEHENSLKLLLDLVGADDSEYFKDGRGKHWAAKRETPMYEVAWRSGDGADIFTIEEACKFVSKTPRQVQLMMSLNKGTAYFNVDDDIVTIRKAPPVLKQVLNSPPPEPVEPRKTRKK